MLVLSRKCGQKLIIDDHIEIIILETKGDSVKIGINAPRSVSVYREEVYTEIKKANQQALATQTNDAVLKDVLALIDQTKQVDS
jgi:carbon storage regulator